MNDDDKQFARIDKIIENSKEDNWESTVFCYCDYLKKELEFPVDVTGIEDFDWEEYYYFGPGDPDEYEELKNTQPSFKDVYSLIEITREGWSEWAICKGDDIYAHVVRKHDQKKFVLGLSELKIQNEKDCSYQLLDDYSTFFWNYR